MKSTNEWFKTAALLCAEVRMDDGVDPRQEARHCGRKVFTHKTMQLCKEAKRVLALMFAGELCEPILNQLQVIDVVSEGEGQFLSVTLACMNKDSEPEESEIRHSLTRARGFLRSAIARSVNRKRIPALKFKYVGLIEDTESQ